MYDKKEDDLYDFWYGHKIEKTGGWVNYDDCDHEYEMRYLLTSSYRSCKHCGEEENETKHSKE